MDRPSIDRQKMGESNMGESNMNQPVTPNVTAGPEGTPAGTILDALPGERVLRSNALATVTTNCLIIKSTEQHSQTIIPILHVSSIREAKTTYPGLLVVGAACLLISAAAYSSKQEGGAALPAAILGVLFVLAYVAHRRVALLFITKQDATPTTEGSKNEAAVLVQAVRAVQAAKAARDDAAGSDP